MLSTGLRYFTDTPLTIIGLFIFLAAFTGIATWTYLRAHSREYYRKMSEMPLHEGDEK